jgi:hypothetical protein
VAKNTSNNLIWKIPCFNVYFGVIRPSNVWISIFSNDMFRHNICDLSIYMLYWLKIICSLFGIRDNLNFWYPRLQCFWSVSVSCKITETYPGELLAGIWIMRLNNCKCSMRSTKVKVCLMLNTFHVHSFGMPWP